MTQYQTKLLNTLNTLEQLSSELLKNTINRVTDLFKKVVSRMYWQAGTALAFGLGTGIAGAAIPMIPNAANPLAKPLLEVLSKGGPQLGQAATTAIHANETKHSLNRQLLQEHGMPETKQMRDSFRNAKDKQEDTISRMQELIHRAYGRG